MSNKPVMKPPTELADCIFIDQRGFGLSRPSLDCPGTYTVSLDEPGSEDLYREAHRQYLSHAVSFWQGQGIDINGYNAREMAGDIDGQLITVEGASHDIAIRGDHCQEMALFRNQFLRGEELSSSQLDAGFMFQAYNGHNQ